MEVFKIKDIPILTQKKGMNNYMKKIIIGAVLGATIVGGFATLAIENYIDLIEQQNAKIVELGNEENSYQYLHFDSYGAEYDNLIADSRFEKDLEGLFMPWSSKKYEEFYSIGTEVKNYDRTPDKDYYYRTGEQFYKWRSFLLEDYIYGSRCLDSDFTESLINHMQSEKMWHENVKLIRDLFKGVKKEDRFDYVHYTVFERDVVMYINEEDMDEFIGFELQTEGFEQKNMGLKFYDELELYKRSQALQYHHDAFK